MICLVYVSMPMHDNIRTSHGSLACHVRYVASEYKCLACHVRCVASEYNCLACHVRCVASESCVSCEMRC